MDDARLTLARALASAAKHPPHSMALQESHRELLADCDHQAAQLGACRRLYASERRARLAAEAKADKLRDELFSLRQRAATLEARLERRAGVES